ERRVVLTINQRQRMSGPRLRSQTLQLPEVDCEPALELSRARVVLAFGARFEGERHAGQHHAAVRAEYDAPYLRVVEPPFAHERGRIAEAEVPKGARNRCL